MSQNNSAPQSKTPPLIDFSPRRNSNAMAARMSGEKPKDTWHTAKRLLRYIGRSGMILVLLILIMLAVTAAEIFSPFFQAKAIDTIQIGDGGLTVDMESLQGCLITMAVIFVCSSILSYFQGVLAAKLAQHTVRGMRNDLFRKISTLPIRYTDTHRHGDIMSRMTNDVENISNAVSQSVTTLFSCVLTIVGALCMMVYYSVEMTLIALVTIPLSILISSKLGKFMRKYFIRQQRLLGQLNGQVEETVTSYKTVVAYGKEDESVEKFGALSGELADCAVKARVWGSIMGPIMNFIGNLQYVLVAATGGWMMLAGRGLFTTRTITIGSIQAMLQYSKKFTHPINMIAGQYSSILTALAGAERVFEIMDAEPEADKGTSTLTPDDIRGEIEFCNLQFGYVSEEPVLKGLNLSVKSGQKIALVGATGSGKTTVVNLLTRFYELDGGNITVDGIDICNIPKATLRRATAIVLQDTVLFSDTIRNNIKYGHPEATDEQMKAAAATAKAARFIERLPNGYDTVLSESGANLSQGQRQLIAIARAVLADPKILILDEATSNVDTRTEMRIQQAMVALMKNRTSLIIAHRLSTIRDADVIVVLRDGVIAEAGSHEELLSQNGEYAKLYSNQFAGIST